jgi:SAM-dependent methyltransferase
MDPVLEVDWAAHWRGLVEAREREAPQPQGFWDRRADRFARSLSGQSDALLEFLEPWLEPSRTLIDVGAGIGRHAVPLAARLDWVTAVEPSAGMRDLIPHVDNMTVVASSWMEADVAPADLVLCSHVLYSVADVVPFLRKLEQAARLRVFLVLRDAPHPRPAELLAAHLGRPRSREPWLRDLFLVLRQMGVAPDCAMFTYPVAHRFASLEDAVAEGRELLGPAWDEARGRRWLEANLRQDEDGMLVHQGGTVTSGVLHWTPRT